MRPVSALYPPGGMYKIVYKALLLYNMEGIEIKPWTIRISY